MDFSLPNSMYCNSELIFFKSSATFVMQLSHAHGEMYDELHIMIFLNYTFGLIHN